MSIEEILSNFIIEISQREEFDKMIEKDKLLFSVGPVEMRRELLSLNINGIPYFRTSEFSRMMKEIEVELLKISNAPINSKIIILTASGTAGMEATLMNCFSKEDKILIISGGSFGDRFVQIAKTHEFKFEVLKLELGKTLKKEDLDKFRNKGFTGLVVNGHETSTGVLYDLEMLGEFSKEENLFFVVDAISTFIADEYDIEKFNINATILSSQKALALSPGLSILILDSKSVERIMKKEVKSVYFNLRDYILNMERGQTPFTPDVGAINELSYRLKEIIDNGIVNERNKIRLIAEDFRERIKGLPLEIFSDKLSNAITPLKIVTDKIKAYELFENLEKKYDITILPSGGELRDTLFRVGHLGNLSVEDNKKLIDALKKELE